MSEIEIKCCVCLQSPETDSTINPDLILKLQFLIPEVEWLEGYRLCKTCTSQLQIAYEFKNHCLQLESRRKTVSLLPKTEPSYSCFDCGATYPDKSVLANHISTHRIDVEPTNAAVKFICDICNKSYSTKKVLKAHIRKCQSGTRIAKKFSCEVCDLVMGHAKRVVEHCIAEHSMDPKSVKPYICDECPMRFTSSANLIQHKKYHKGNRSHICSFCGKSYITKSDLTVHEYTHFNRRNYKCEFCAKAFNTNKNLRSHILVVHTEPSLWKFGCGICHRRFPLKSGYEQHMKRHAGDKKFACHICDKSFVSRSELHKHMTFHSMERPFKCTLCAKAYKEKRLFEVHLTRNHGIGNAKIPLKEKKFACHVCPSTFFDRQKLERHLRAHSGTKPFLCNHCDKKFSDKYYLKQHIKNLHKLGGGEDFSS